MSAVQRIADIEKEMAITNKNVIRWSSFQVDPATKSNDPAVKRFGFMSQISPDGRYVVTSIGTPDNKNKNGQIIPGMANGLLDRLFSTNNPAMRLARDLGIAAVNRTRPLKRVFMRRAMGT